MQFVVFNLNLIQLRLGLIIINTPAITLLISFINFRQAILLNTIKNKRKNMQIESGAQTAQDKWITHVLRAHRTLHEMLKDRSYVVSDDKMDMTRDQMKSKLGFNNITREDGTATQKVAVDPCQHLNNIYKRAEQGDNADVEDPEMND